MRLDHTSPSTTFPQSLIASGILPAAPGGDLRIDWSTRYNRYHIGTLGFAWTGIATVGAAPTPQPQPSPETFSGGFLYAYELERSHRHRRKREQDELEAEARALQNKVDAEIALLLRAKEAEEERQAELDRLQSLVRNHSNRALELSDRAKIAYVRVLTQANFSALEALDRELERMLFEEESAALMLLLNED